MKNDDKKFYSVLEVAKMLQISRVAVFKKIRAGKIKAHKVGRSFIISHQSLMEAMGHSLYRENKADIDKAVKRAVREYGETFKLLGKE